MNDKVCFGNHETNNNSWHCHGCPISKECKSFKEAKLIAMEKINAERISKDNYYIDIAIAVSKRSTCLKRHYGCVIVKDDIIIATGYNGSPRGEDNCCDIGECKRPNAERYSGYENCNSVHAEQNALIAASRDRLIGATVYLACEERVIEGDFESLKLKYGDWNEDYEPKPCPLCLRMLKNSGVTRIVNRKGDIECL